MPFAKTKYALLCLLVGRMLAAETAILAKLKFFGLGLFVFCGCIVSLLADSTSEGNNVSH